MVDTFHTLKVSRQAAGVEDRSYYQSWVEPRTLSAGSSRPLLRWGLIDYAGLFPPAALAMDDAVGRYARPTGAGRDAWMLGRFIVPASRLGEFEQRRGVAAGRPGRRRDPVASQRARRRRSRRRRRGDRRVQRRQHARRAHPTSTLEVKAASAEVIASPTLPARRRSGSRWRRGPVARRRAVARSRRRGMARSCGPAA